MPAACSSPTRATSAQVVIAPASRAPAEGVNRTPSLSAALAVLGLRVLRGVEADDGIRSEARLAGLEGVLLCQATDSAHAAWALEQLARRTDVEWAEPNRVRLPCIEGVRPLDFPNDPLFADSRQWGLRNLGARGVYGGVDGADIDVASAWSRSVGGRDVLLALADTGVDPTHPELQAFLSDGGMRMVHGIDVTEPGAAFADSFGHGTMVAGVMAARTGEGIHFDSLGIAGVCGGDGRMNPGCRLIPIKITPGRSGYASSFDIANAILYATSRGARAINISFTGGGPSRFEREAMRHAITHGCVVVAASGNRGFSDGLAPQYPAAYAADGLGIQVGASDCFDRRAVFSSYGPGLDLIAPGVDIWSTYMQYPSTAGASYPGYVAVSGTSFATPFVTGVVGLLSGMRPELSAGDFQPLLCATADDIEAPGADSVTGSGRLDAGRALDAVAPEIAIWHDEVPAHSFRVLDRDTLTIVEGGPGSLGRHRGRTWAERVEVAAEVPLPDSIGPPVRAWTRVGGTTTLRGSFRIPYYAPWSDALVSGRTLRLRGFVYRVLESPDPTDPIGPAGDGSPEDAWVPFPSDMARFGFTVMGRRRPDSMPSGARATVTRPQLRVTPNPFGRAARLSVVAAGEISIFDVAGRSVRRFALARGSEVQWDGTDDRGGNLSPGLYLVRYAPSRETGSSSKIEVVKLVRLSH